jgi:ABC-type bacteriocin/lantibiotic exporter with double-glycine peptidase domain
MKNVTRPRLNPLLALFLKLTAAVTIAMVLLLMLWHLLKIILIAAVVAAIGIGALLLYNLVRRRSNTPAIR